MAHALGVVLWELRKEDRVLRCRVRTIQPAEAFVDLEITDHDNLITAGRLEAGVAHRFANRFRRARPSTGWVLDERHSAGHNATPKMSDDNWHPPDRRRVGIPRKRVPGFTVWTLSEDRGQHVVTCERRQDPERDGWAVRSTEP